jgi:hypothetical protein
MKNTKERKKRLMGGRQFGEQKKAGWISIEKLVSGISHTGKRRNKFC